MSQAIIEKSVGGKFPVGLRYFAPDLEVGETISSASVTVSPAGGLILGATVIDGNEVSASIDSGTIENTYKVQFKVTTSSGKIFQHPTRDSIVVKIVY